MNPYYTLLDRDDRLSPWRIAYGDPSLWMVQDEMAEYIAIGARNADLVIVTTDGQQPHIDALVAQLNERDKATV